MIAPSVDFFYHGQYKYLISCDGFGAAWGRVPCALATGSVLFLQASSRQFFYPLLQPWVHYVPVKDDLSDLMVHYDYLEANPNHAKDIGEQGRLFAHQYLQASFLQRYLGKVIKELSLVMSNSN